MVQGQAIQLTPTQTEEVYQAMVQGAPAEVKPLLEGIGSGIVTMLLGMVTKWLQDPANLQLIISKLLELFTKKS